MGLPCRVPFAIYNTHSPHVPFTACFRFVSVITRPTFAMTSQVRTLEPGLDAVDVLEGGDIICLRPPSFPLDARERPLLSAAVLARGKNVSFDPATGTVGGSALQGERAEALRDLLARFSDEALALVGRLLPEYRERVRRGRTSFRPIEVAGRTSSW